MQDVRIAGYTAIADLSRGEPKWTKRNTDVLLQLLQSDDPTELDIITKALITHVETSPAAALSVMTDHCLADGPLRKLVLELFFNNSVEILGTLQGPNDEGEKIFVNGIKKCLTETLSHRAGRSRLETSHSASHVQKL